MLKQQQLTIMADEEPSPRPFRRERNLSNRNFNKRGSNRRRFSTESHSSAESKIYNLTNSPDDTTTTQTEPTDESGDTSSTSVSLNVTSSSMDISYSVNSDTENAFNKKSILKMRSIDINIDDNNDHYNTDKDDNENNINKRLSGKKLQRQTPTTPTSPDPALLGVRQKLLLFENLQSDERIIFKTSKYKSKSSQSLLQSERVNSSNNLSTASSTSGSYLVNVYPMGNSNTHLEAIRNSSFHASIDEERSEDEVDSIKDEVNENEVSEIGEEGTQDEFGRSVSREERQLPNDDSIPVAAINKSFLTPVFQHSQSHPEDTTNTKDKNDNDKVKEEEGVEEVTTHKPRNKDFPR